jgi:stearoyl-CoA desaturase (Delta-9 desaturase)
LSQDRAQKAPLNLPATFMFLLTFSVTLALVPWYGITHGYSAATWVWFMLIVGANGMAITCGYHRLLAHSSYDAHPLLKAAYLFFGAMALQNSALVWAAGHRVHHRFIDDEERDPYCAKKGFWFSHMGWMLRNYPSGDIDFSGVKDLQRDPMVMFQHRFYLPIALAANFGVPVVIGLFLGDVWGSLLVVGFLRLVVSHQVTFFINSLAHMWGSQPYTSDNTARDNPIVALLTYGEGYHNFHHLFAHDYRNGVRWWQFDPSKWFIRSMSFIGMASNLKQVPWFKIHRALLDRQFQRVEHKLATHPARAQLGLTSARIADEYETFKKAVAEWAHLREQWLGDTKRAVVERWEKSNLQVRLRELEYGLQLQYRRMRALQAQLS